MHQWLEAGYFTGDLPSCIQKRQRKEKTVTETTMQKTKEKNNEKGHENRILDNVKKESIVSVYASSDTNGIECSNEEVFEKRQEERIECSATSSEKKSRTNNTSGETVKRSQKQKPKGIARTPTPIGTPNEERGFEGNENWHESNIKDDLMEEENIIAILPFDSEGQESRNQAINKMSSRDPARAGDRDKTGSTKPSDGTGDIDTKEIAKRSRKELLKSCIVESNPEMSKLVTKARIDKHKDSGNASPSRREETKILNKELLKAFIGSRPAHARRRASMQKSKTAISKDMSRRKKKSLEPKKDPPKHSEKEPPLSEVSLPEERRVTFSPSVKSAASFTGIPSYTSNADDASRSSEESGNDVQVIHTQQYPGLADSSFFHALDPWIFFGDNESLDAYTYDRSFDASTYDSSVF